MNEGDSSSVEECVEDVIESTGEVLLDVDVDDEDEEEEEGDDK